MVDETDTDEVTATSKRVDALEQKLAQLEAAHAEFKARVEHMATYLGVRHELKVE